MPGIIIGAWTRSMPARKRPEPTEPLFDDEAAPDAPLAARMRPRTLDEFVGQPNLVGDGGALTRVVQPGHLPSMILWGMEEFHRPERPADRRPPLGERNWRG